MEAPKILGLSGSPRKGGNTDLLLSAFLEGAAGAGAETEKLYLSDLRIHPCLACDACSKDGRCIIEDDMQGIYTKILASSGIVLATPIYFGTLSGQTKVFMDRFQCWWNARYTLGKPFIKRESNYPAFFICVGALKKPEYAQNALAAAKVFFAVLNMRLQGHLCYQGYDARGVIRENSHALKEAGQAGAGFAALARGERGEMMY